MHVRSILEGIKSQKLFPFETPDELGILARKLREKTTANPNCSDLRFVKTAPNTFALLEWYAEESEREDAFQATAMEIADGPLLDAGPDVPCPVASSQQASATTRPRRDPQIAATSIALAGFKCESECGRALFRSAKSEKNYVEAHHLVPLSAQAQFPYSLDVSANIVALCPHCHKVAHHAHNDVRRPMLAKLLDLRRSRLKSCGIDVQGELIELY